MNPNQKRIIELSYRKDISSMTLRQIAEEAGLNSDIKKVSPQTVKYHLDRLIEKHLIGNIKGGDNKSSKGLLKIPLLARADCGPATQVAMENLEGYLKISSRLVGKSNSDKLIAVRAIGSSMTRANVGGKSIDDGDYVIVDCANNNPQNGQYVLSVIDGVANIKRFYIDNNEVRLVSESNIEIPPIVIHQEDNYLINGVVLMVVKKN